VTQIVLKDDDSSDCLLNDTIEEIKTQTQKALYDNSKPKPNSQYPGTQKRYQMPSNSRFKDGGPKSTTCEKVINES